MIALLVHLPLIPSYLGTWIQLMLAPEQPPLPDSDQEATLPIDLEIGMFDDDPAQRAAAAEKQAAEAAKDSAGDGILILDGGVPEPSDDDDDDDDLTFDDDDDDDDELPDAGTAALDAGIPEPDAGDEADAGALTEDAGLPDADLPDGGVVDGGATDAGAGGGAADGGQDIGIADAGDDAGMGPIAALDGGSAVPAAGDAGDGLGAVTTDAGADAGAAEPLASASASASASAPPAPLRDPRSAAGAAGALQATQANVKIYIAADVLRKHSLAPTFGKLLNAVPQWDQLLGGTGIDPIRDFDHLMITGPQMVDARWIVAVMDYSMPSFRMQVAIDKVVKKSKKGRWLRTKPFPIAQIGADGGRRVALIPAHKLLVVAPEQLEKKLDKYADNRGFGKSGVEGIILKIRNPWRVIRGFPIPNTVTSLKLTLSLKGKDFEVKIQAHDKDPETARKTAEDMEKRILAIRGVPGAGALSGLGKSLGMNTASLYFFGKPDFRVDGRKIHVRADVSSSQVGKVMTVALGFIRSNAAKKQ